MEGKTITNEEIEKEIEKIAELLKVLSGKNCLKILRALSEPKYWSQLIEELNMHRWVLKKYIDKLLQCGLIESFVKPAERGPPRRYFQISRNLTLLLEVSPEGVHIHQFALPRVRNIHEIFRKYPSIKKIVEELKKIEQIPTPFRREEFIEQLKSKIEEEISTLSMAIDFLRNILKQLED